MKALSILHPYAALIAAGIQTIETRSWYTPYRGPLAIHASKRFDMVSYDWYCGGDESGFGDVLCAAGYCQYEDFPRGAVIAVAELVDCHSTNDDDWTCSIPETELKYGNYEDNRFGWVLREVRRLPEPIPAKGSLGLWDFEEPDPAAAIPRLGL